MEPVRKVWVKIRVRVRHGILGRTRSLLGKARVQGLTMTLTAGILDHIKAVAPSVYGTMEYTIVDISPAMASRCQSVKNSHPCCKLINASALEWEERVEERCHVVAMEMLDNMPHDKASP